MGQRVPDRGHRSEESRLSVDHVESRVRRLEIGRVQLVPLRVVGKPHDVAAAHEVENFCGGSRLEIDGEKLVTLGAIHDAAGIEREIHKELGVRNPR